VKGATAAALLVVGLVSGGRAVASPLFELVGGLPGEGGLNPRVVVAGTASTYFNPALLPDVDADFDLGVVVISDQIGIRLSGRPDARADLPVDSIEAERPGGGRLPRYGIPTEWLDSGKAAEPPDQPLAARPRQGRGSSHSVRAYQTLGLVRRLVPGRLAVGLYAMIPYRRFTGAAAFYSDEREQYFSNSLHPELYADRLTATSLAFGVGGKLHRRLSLGVVFTLALRTVAATPTFLDDVGNFQDIMVDSDVAVKAALAPHFGAAFTPVDGTRLCATVHSPQKTEIGTDFSFLLANGLEQRAAIRFTHAYLPWTFAVGGTQQLWEAGGGQSELTLAATATYALWSRYLDRHSERPSPGYAWYDTLSGALGLRHRHRALRGHLDLAYLPSAVPDQTGRTNYVDNDRASASGGLALAFRWPAVGLRVGLGAQVHRLRPRDTVKLVLPSGGAADLVIDELPDDSVRASLPATGRDGLQTNNPGWPGFGSAGWIVAAGTQLSLTF
jgi:long-chain fatty acid transport protein